MKIVLLISVLLVQYTNAVLAQNLSEVNIGQIVQREVESMKVRLALTDSQQIEVQAIQQAFYDSLKALPAKLGIEHRTERFDRLLKKKEAMLQELLTVEQWKRHQEFLDQRKDTVQRAILERRNRFRMQRGI